MAKVARTLKINNGVRYLMIPKNEAIIAGIDKKVFVDFDGTSFTITKMPSKSNVRTKVKVKMARIAKMLNVDIDQIEIEDYDNYID